MPLRRPASVHRQLKTIHQSIMKFIILAALVAVAAAADVYSKPAYQPAYPAKTYEYPAQPYSYSYAVDDQPSYNHYSQSESSDGKVVSGSYKVVLPDGRTQTVTYKDDGYGLVADVKTDGYVNEYKPAYKPAYSAPAYKPAAYPAPAYPTPAYPAPAKY